jgi:hypothetical protein
MFVFIHSATEEDSENQELKTPTPTGCRGENEEIEIKCIDGNVDGFW